MAGRDLSLFYDDMPMFRSDPFSALLPFAVGNTRLASGGKHRDMPIDVREVRTHTGCLTALPDHFMAHEYCIKSVIAYDGPTCRALVRALRARMA